MGNQGSGQTTLPSRGRRGQSDDRNRVVVRWIHPEQALTELSAAKLLFGRGEDCDAVLPGRETSRHHAELRRDGPIFVLRDLSSRNGVFVNGQRCQESPIAPGDLIRLGDWVGLLDRSSEDALEGISELVPGLWAGDRMRAAIEPAKRAAASDLPVIVEGETGTGKECVARAIHAWSARSGAFVAVNCAALPEALAESELFGYKKGAFTGAARDSQGYFRAADRGTLLLDEIVDLPAAVQAKLLRVIETGEVVPLGETRPIRVDVRLVAAAQWPLRRGVTERRFRADLLARLEGVAVVLPPLRERREDVPGLFLQLLAQHSGGNPPRVDAILIERLCLHDWPYNVRELVQLVRRMLALHGSASVLTEAHTPDSLRRVPPSVPAAGQSRAISGSRRQRVNAALLQRLTEALERHGGNLARAAKAVGISRQRAYRLLERDRSVDLDALRFPEPPDGSEP